MNSTNFRNIFFNEQNQLEESNIFKQKNLNSNMNLPLLTINSFDTGDYERDITNLKKQIFQNKTNFNKKKEELQFLKIKYNKLVRENRNYRKLIYEVLELHDETKSNLDSKIYQENYFETPYISEEQLLNKINNCKIDKKQEKKLKNSFEMMNLKDKLNIKRELLFTKRREYKDLKYNISLKNRNEMKSKLENIRVNEKKIQNVVTVFEDYLQKNKTIENELLEKLEEEEKKYEKIAREELEYKSKYIQKSNEEEKIKKELEDIDNRRKNKIYKNTKNVQFEGGKLKGLKLKLHIQKISNELDEINEYEKERDKLIDILEQKRKKIDILKKNNQKKEDEIRELDEKNTKLYLSYIENKQEKNILENRGKEQNRDIKELKFLEEKIEQLEDIKNKLDIEIEDKINYLNNLKESCENKSEKNEKENDTDKLKILIKENKNLKSKNDKMKKELESIEKKIQEYNKITT